MTDDQWICFQQSFAFIFIDFQSEESVVHFRLMMIFVCAQNFNPLEVCQDKRICVNS